jgi:hypothetical protein
MLIDPLRRHTNLYVGGERAASWPVWIGALIAIQ